jgi:hypothetical protein
LSAFGDVTLLGTMKMEPGDPGLGGLDGIAALALQLGLLDPVRARAHAHARRGA